jgi:hypothetical protein
MYRKQLGLLGHRPATGVQQQVGQVHSSRRAAGGAHAAQKPISQATAMRPKPCHVG